MAELKTKKNKADPKKFIESVDNEKRQKDAMVILKMMEDITGSLPAMWGPSIIGYGSYRYKYKSGREIEWFLTGFSPRKASLSLYIMSGFDKYEEYLKKLGKHKIGKGCLYINKLEDVDQSVLKDLITASVNYLRAKHSN